MSLLAFTTMPQKLLMGGMAVVLLAAGGLNIKQAIENRSLTKHNVRLDQRINDPERGYVVRLTQAQANVETCRGSLDTQNAAIRGLSERSRASVAAIQARYNTEHAARRRAEREVAGFLARAPRGATVADRVADVDARILEDLR